MASDGCGNLYLAGQIAGTLEFPADSFQTEQVGRRDGFLFRLSGDLSSAIDGTFLGTSGVFVRVGDVEVYEGKVYLGGGSGGGSVPTTPGAFAPAQSGGRLFASAFSTLYLESPDQLGYCPTGDPFLVDQIAHCGGVAPYSYLWVAESATNVISESNLDTLNPTLALSGPTTYVLTVTDAAGEAQTRAIEFVPADDTMLGAGPDRNVCLPGQSVLIGLTEVEGATYSWSPAATLDDATLAQPTATPAATTTYTVTYDCPGGPSGTDTVTVFVDAPPSAALAIFADGYEVCAAVPTVIGEPGLDSFLYEWSPATFLDSANKAQPVATALSAQEYTLTATSLCSGLSASKTVTLDFAITSANAGEDKLTCPGVGVVVGNPAQAGISSYLWEWVTGNPGTISDPTAAQPTVTLATSGSFELRLTATSAECGATQDIMMIEVPSDTPAANAGPDKESCVNWPDVTTWQSVQIGTLSVNGVTYSWSPTLELDDPTSAEPNVDLNFWVSSNPGDSLVCTLTTTAVCGGAIDTNTVTVTLAKRRSLC